MPRIAISKTKSSFIDSSLPSTPYLLIVCIACAVKAFKRLTFSECCIKNEPYFIIRSFTPYLSITSNTVSSPLPLPLFIALVISRCISLIFTPAFFKPDVKSVFTSNSFCIKLSITPRSSRY